VNLGFGHFPLYRLFLIGATAIVVIGLWLFIEKTRFGLIIRAGSRDPEIVRVLGIDALLAAPLAPALWPQPVAGEDRLVFLDPDAVFLNAAARSALRGAEATADSQPLVLGFYVNWDDNSFFALQAHARDMDWVVGEWAFLSDSGTGVQWNLGDTKRKDVLGLVKQLPPAERPRLFAMLTNVDPVTHSFENPRARLLLSSERNRQRVIRDLADGVTRLGLAGITVDIEGVDEAERAGLALFVRALRDTLHARGAITMQTVAADASDAEMRAAGANADYVIDMLYDEHYPTGDPGPVAGQAWYDESAVRALTLIPREKAIFAIGTYGYHWDDTGDKRPAESATFAEVMRAVREHKGAISFTSPSLNPVATWTEPDSVDHQVWFLDATTAWNELSTAVGLGARGVALWRLGAEDPSLWKVVGRRRVADPARALADVAPGYDVEFEGEGEILRVRSRPTLGHRAIGVHTESELITRVKWTQFPSPYVIERTGSSAPHRVALTFDDGPDGRWTPAILDTLRSRGVHATFFIIGSAALTEIPLTRRLMAEGHELGNHTFTHPNLAITPSFITKLELDATERLIEAITDRRSALFRPPYFGDAEPTTPDELVPVSLANDLGYITVGLHVDSDDWLEPGAGQIVANVLNARHKGNVVLLHDSGGDRSQTVAAIGPLIDSLKARGDTVVLLSELLGLTRDQAMPPLPPTSAMSRNFTLAAFFAVGALQVALQWIFIVAVVLGAIRIVVVLALAIVHRVRNARRGRATLDFAPHVSVIVPAYNEAKVIEKTIRSLLAQNYRGTLDVVVVDDGSPDGTGTLAQAAFHDDPRVMVLIKENGGKASALNFGIERARGEIVICLDADTVFEAQTIAELVDPLRDPQVGAVAGNAKVGNRLNLVTRWQALEYVTSQNVDRRAFDLLNCITVVPGAVGAWRRSALLRAGGFTHDTLAEDQDATIELRKRGWRIAYAEHAVAWTEAPDTFRSLVKQRFRWSFGTLQCAWKHRGTCLRREFGTLGMVAMPNTWLFQLLFTAISPLADLIFLFSVIGIGVTWVEHGPTYAQQTGLQLAAVYLIFLLMDWVAAVVAFMLEPGEERSLTWLILIQRFAYRQLMYWVVVKSFVAAARGGLVGWGTLERKGTVAPVATVAVERRRWGRGSASPPAR
jgi:cellulose synthase/poly-beta-1,6-N-acetylglucosamine synthase-like glycosyltransferase/peptidoglycan/xylan/chitin deacetylase (PgdA/CDA1 family)/spore germination protein YaaH